MDEIGTLKRLVNLSSDEIGEIEKDFARYASIVGDLISVYNDFELEKVKAGRLKTLHENLVYKINFSYGELYRTAREIEENYRKIKEKSVEIEDALDRKIREILSENIEKKELIS